VWPLFVGVGALAITWGWGGPVFGGLEPLWVVMVGFFAIGILVLWSGIPASESLPHAGALAFGSLYLGVPWIALTFLKHAGPAWVLLLLATVWLCDSAAYYSGRAFGRRKLAPLVSPNKTWEGAIGGTFAALFGGLGWSLWQFGTIDPALLAWVLVAAIAGQLGDLFESKLKRGAQVKDSGNLLPGHGGVLDRIDALLFAAPVLAIAVTFFPSVSGT